MVKGGSRVALAQPDWCPDNRGSGQGQAGGRRPPVAEERYLGGAQALTPSLGVCPQDCKEHEFLLVTPLVCLVLCWVADRLVQLAGRPWTWVEDLSPSSLLGTVIVKTGIGSSMPLSLTMFPSLPSTLPGCPLVQRDGVGGLPGASKLVL